MAVVTLSAVVHREEDLYVADCPELGTVSQARTIEEAVANLKEATALYLEEQEESLAVAPAILTTFSVDTANSEAAWGFRAKRVIAALERLGFKQVRSRGSHVVMARSRPDVGARRMCRAVARRGGGWHGSRRTSPGWRFTGRVSRCAPIAALGILPNR